MATSTARAVLLPEPEAAPDPPPRGRRFLTMKEVSAMTALGRSSIEKLCARGQFPRRVKLDVDGVVASRWEWHEVQAWMEARLAARGAR